MADQRDDLDDFLEEQMRDPEFARLFAEAEARSAAELAAYRAEVAQPSERRCEGCRRPLVAWMVGRCYLCAS